MSTLLVTKHERCTCGHCRCEHYSGYQECRADRVCIRYSWPGSGADLKPDHFRAKLRKLVGAA